MQLSLRLSAIANMVTEGNRLVDVGCNHGYLPVSLMKHAGFPEPLLLMWEKDLWPVQRSISSSIWT